MKPDAGMPPLLQPRALLFFAAAAVVVNGFFPALWILFTSLKTEAELVSKPITWWPRHATLQNYVQAFADQPLLLYLGNSAAVALCSTVVSLVVSESSARTHSAFTFTAKGGHSARLRAKSFSGSVSGAN